MSQYLYTFKHSLKQAVLRRLLTQEELTAIRTVSQTIEEKSLEPSGYRFADVEYRKLSPEYYLTHSVGAAGQGLLRQDLGGASSESTHQPNTVTWLSEQYYPTYEQYQYLAQRAYCLGKQWTKESWKQPEPLDPDLVVAEGL